jgi:2-(1,2-epoxy-1,2-dihydrophenyl)acetyl-CoA isomerase
VAHDGGDFVNVEYQDRPGLRITLDGPVLCITLDRPERRNALTDEMVYDLVTVLECANQDERVRAILLDSTSGDFCTGFDLGGRGAARERAGATQRRLPAHAHRLVSRVTTVQVPVVAAVRGYAAGVGLHVALAADFCVAADDARLWEPFVHRGFTPDSGGTWLLPRLVGVARAKRLLMLGDPIDGTTAAQWGVVHSALPADEVTAAARALADRLAQGPTVTLGLLKNLVREGLATEFDSHLAREALALELSTRSDDFKEGMRALGEKRAADFTGR